jgi:2,3-bisphosphoglycerate-independent phosphoglycerate mutase
MSGSTENNPKNHTSQRKPFVLLILDGFGYRQATEHNAIALAQTPCWDSLQQKYPHTLLECSGEVVGLPEDQMGNSEVGHLHIGSGRFVFQDLSRVNKAIREGVFFENPVLCQAVDTAISKNKALHIMGLLSDGGVHSHQSQILAMVELAAKRGLTKVYLHAFLDGRDVSPKSAAEFLNRTEEKLAQLGVGRIVSLIGRFYVMDRDHRWERVQRAYKLIAEGQAERQARTALEGLAMAYQNGETDEFVSPTAIVTDGEAIVALDPEDSVVFMNFRADRAREISQALTAVDFNDFVRGCPPHHGYFATLTEYHQAFNYPIAFPTLELNNGLGEVLARMKLTQLRLAETEKYAHVTFFLNGGRDEPFAGESRILVPSPKVKTYDLQPEMNALLVTDHLVDSINQGEFDVIICNYANCDMVGHTGDLAAAIIAVETIDRCLQRVVAAIESVGGQLLLTADHGNIEQMLDEVTGQAHTAHTMNPVPLLYIGGAYTLASGGSLADLAPTILDLLAIPQPVEMTGRSLKVIA